MDDLALRAGALLAFLAILGGGVYAAEQAFGDRDAPGGRVLAGAVTMAAAEAGKSALPGGEVTFPVVVRNGKTEAAHVTLATGSGFAVRFSPASLDVPPRGEQGAFATVTVPPNAAPGAARVLVQATVGGQPVASLPLALSVARPGGGAGEGDQVEVEYVGRFPNGTVFDTNVQAVGDGPFPKLEGRRQYEPLSLLLSGQGGTIDGFWTNLTGLAVGQSRTFTLAPEDAFGGATVREEDDRQVVVPRLSQPFPRSQTFPRSILSQQLNESSKVGDNLTIADRNGNSRLFQVTALDAINATITWQVRVGEPFTIYGVWPGQSRAFRVTPESVVFRTTPDDANATFTFDAAWPNMSRVLRLNDTEIIVQHDPPVGLEYVEARSGQQVAARVVAVTADKVVSELPNRHPLANETVVFDVTMREVRRTASAP